MSAERSAPDRRTVALVYAEAIGAALAAGCCFDEAHVLALGEVGIWFTRRLRERAA